MITLTNNAIMFTTGGGTMYPFVTVSPPADTGQQYDIIIYASIYYEVWTVYV